MTDEVLAILTSDVLMAIAQCEPRELFTPKQLIKWARQFQPDEIFRNWDLEEWALDNGWISEDDAALDAERIVHENNSPSELLDFIKSLDREMGKWEFTQKVRDWAIAEMEKHELVKA